MAQISSFKCRFPRGLSVRWLLAAIVLAGAGLPMLLLGVLEVRGLTSLEQQTTGCCNVAAARLAKESANALQLHAIKAISQTLTDKASSVNEFFKGIQGLVVLEHDFALRALGSDAASAVGKLIPAANMRDAERRPKDAAADPVRGCIVSFSAPLVHAPPGAAPEVVDKGKQFLARLAFELKSILEQDPKLILFTYAANADGMFMSYPADAGLAEGYDPRTRDWYRLAVKAHGPVWTSPYQDAGTGVMVMTCAAAVRVDGRCAAVVALDVRLDLFMKEVLALRSEPRAEAALLDREGKFVVPPHMARTPDGKIKTPSEVYEEANIKRIVAGKYDMFNFDYAGVQRFAGAKHIPAVGWHMVVTMPRDITLALSRKMERHVQATGESIKASIRSSVRGAVRRLGAAALIVAAFAIAMAAGIGHVLSRPIRLLTDMARRVARGEFDVRAPDMPTREFNALAQSFNTMTQDLAQYTERIAREAADRQRITTELATAAEIQSSLLCDAFPNLPGAQVHAVWQPARETAGDFYDVIPLADGRIGLLMADVSGKGLGAAVFMTMAWAIVRTHASAADLRPDEVFRRANATMVAQEHANMFVTAIYAIYDPKTGLIQLCDAGHTYPVVSINGECWEMHVEGGIPLGIMEDGMYSTVELSLAPGDNFVLYTDGVTEAFSAGGEKFEADRLVDVCKRIQGQPAEAICREVLAAVRTWSAGRPQSDDIAILALTRNAAE